MATTAARFDAVGDALTRVSAGVVTNATIAGWFYVDTDRNNWSVLAGWEVPGEWLLLELDATGSNLVFTSNPGSIDGPDLTPGTWYYVAGTATSGNVGLIYTGNDGTPGVLTGTGSGTTGPQATASTFWIGNHSGSEWLDGRAAFVRVWNAILTESELEAEMSAATAVRTSGLWGDWPLQADANDISGNGRHLTVNGTVPFTAVGPTSVVTATATQEGFRWRNDDGDEDGATWLASQDTNASVALDTNVRLRTLIDFDGDPGTTQYQLEYRIDGGSTWSAIGPAVPTAFAAGTMAAFASGTTITTTLPGSLQAGDIMVLALMANGSTTFSTPTDWTLLGTSIESNANQSTEWFWKRHDGSESNPASTTSATMSATLGGYGRVYAFRGCVASGDPFVDVTMAGSPTTDNNPDSAAIDTTDVQQLAVCLLSVDDDNTWSSGHPPALWTTFGTIQTSTTGGDAMMTAITRPMATAGAVAAVTIGTMTAADYWRSITFALIPAVPPITYALSSQYTDGTATTAQLTAPSGKSTSDFDAGVMVEGQALATTVDVSDDDYTEIEWALKAQAPAVDTEVYEFRVTANGTALSTYSVTPELTISSSSPINVTVPTATATLAGVTPAGAGSGAVTVTVPTASLTLVGRTPMVDATAYVTVPTAVLTASGLTPAAAGTGVASVTVPVASRALIGVTPAAAGTGVATKTVPVASLILTGRTPLPSVFAVIYPATISGRKILDQHGSVYLLRTMSSWGMMVHLTDAEITTALEGLAALGFNGVTVGSGGYDIGGWNEYTTAEHGNLWTGTPWASSLSTGWEAMDWIAEETARLNMTLTFTFVGANSTSGAGDDWEARTNGQMRQAGIDICNRYLGYPHILWHIWFDDGTSPGDTRGIRIKALFDGINDTEGPTARPIRWVETQTGTTTHSEGWVADVDVFALNGMYFYDANSVEWVENIYSESVNIGPGSTPWPFGDTEPPYDGSPHYTGSDETSPEMGQQLRERSYAIFVEGGMYINYSHEQWWPFGHGYIFDSDVDAGDWEAVLTHDHTIQQSYIWSLMDQYVADTTWAPSSFVTTGEGSGDTKAAAGASDTAAIAYFPSNRTVAVNTTVIAGTGNVRLRWYDPTAGTYSTIAASEAQQTGRSVTIPAAHADGSRDWVLVVDDAGVFADIPTALLDLDGVTPAGSGSGAVTKIIPIASATLTALTPAAAGSGAATNALPTATVVLTALTPVGAGSGAVQVAVPVAVLTLAALTPAGSGSGAVSVAVAPATATLAALTPTAAGTGEAVATIPVAVLTLIGVPPAGVAGAFAAIPAATLTLAALTPAAAGTGEAQATVPPATGTLVGVTPAGAGSGEVTATVPVAVLALAGITPNPTSEVVAVVPVASLLLTPVTPTAAGTGQAVAAIPIATAVLEAIAPIPTGTGPVTVAIPVATVTVAALTPGAAGTGIATAVIPIGLLALVGVAVGGFAGSLSPHFDEGAVLRSESGDGVPPFSSGTTMFSPLYTERPG